MVDKYFNMYMS